MSIWISVVILIGIIIWFVWSYFNVRRSAKFVDNAEFESLIRGGQLIDVRESNSFQSKHILGARNFPANQFEMSLSALRKDKPVLIYDNSRSSAPARVVKILKKAKYTDVYVLRDGFDYWTGKVKEQKS